MLHVPLDHSTMDEALNPFPSDDFIVADKYRSKANDHTHCHAAYSLLSSLSWGGCLSRWTDWGRSLRGYFMWFLCSFGPWWFWEPLWLRSCPVSEETRYTLE